MLWRLHWVVMGVRQALAAHAVEAIISASLEIKHRALLEDCAHADWIYNSCKLCTRCALQMQSFLNRFR